MNKTINERVDDLEDAVKNIMASLKSVMDRVSELKQPVIIEKVKYRNRVKPLVKKKPAIMQGKKKVGNHWEPINKGGVIDKVLVSEDGVQAVGNRDDAKAMLFTEPNKGQNIIETRQEQLN